MEACACSGDHDTLWGYALEMLQGGTAPEPENTALLQLHPAREPHRQLDRFIRTHFITEAHPSTVFVMSPGCRRLLSGAGAGSRQQAAGRQQGAERPALRRRKASFTGSHTVQPDSAQRCVDDAGTTCIPPPPQLCGWELLSLTERTHIDTIENTSKLYCASVSAEHQLDRRVSVSTVKNTRTLQQQRSSNNTMIISPPPPPLLLLQQSHLTTREEREQHTGPQPGPDWDQFNQQAQQGVQSRAAARFMVQ
ncbi:hypothetical protein INR49_031709 [Caranx melampygus]|nr:hypothetical protein INR49_031709 [Caranx melampygus]